MAEQQRHLELLGIVQHPLRGAVGVAREAQTDAVVVEGIDVVGGADGGIVAERRGRDAVFDGDGVERAGQCAHDVEQRLGRRVDEAQPRAGDDGTGDGRLGVERGEQADQPAQRMAKLEHGQAGLLDGKLDHGHHVALEVAHAGDASLALLVDVAAMAAVVVDVDGDATAVHDLGKALVAVAVLAQAVRHAQHGAGIIRLKGARVEPDAVRAGQLELSSHITSSFPARCWRTAGR